MKISLIVAHGKNHELGLNNRIPWNVPADLQLFKKLTIGHHVVMGRKTFESIGKPLPNRKIIILSRKGMDVSKYENVFCVSTIEKALQLAVNNSENELFIAGGAQIYNQFASMCDTYYISEIDYEGDADVYLTPLNRDNYNLTECSLQPKTKTTPSWFYKEFVKKK